MEKTDHCFAQAQYIESLSAVHKSVQTWHRCEINAWEMMCAVHVWLCQISLHCGYYLFMRKSEEKVADTRQKMLINENIQLRLAEGLQDTHTRS